MLFPRSESEIIFSLNFFIVNKRMIYIMIYQNAVYITRSIIGITSFYQVFH